MFTTGLKCLAGLAALVAMAILAVPGPVVAKAPDGSIAEARQQPLGSTVTVVGVATSFTGAFFPNDNGFAIQEKKVGIYILDSLDADIEVGQVVRVTGTLTNSFGQVLSVGPASIEVLGEENVPPLRTNSFGQVLSVGPASIEVLGEENVPPPHPAKTGDVSELEQGQRVVIQGFSAEFLGEYEVDPVFQEDIRILPAR